VKIRKKWFRKLVEKNISEQFFGECDSVCSADFLQTIVFKRTTIFFTVKSYLKKIWISNLL